MTEPPPLPAPPPPPPPARPVDGGRIALTIMGTLAASFLFSMGARFALAGVLDDATQLGTAAILLAWFLPIALLAVVAIVATRRGWKWVAIALWIYVGLGTLTSVVCGALIGGGL